MSQLAVQPARTSYVTLGLGDEVFAVDVGHVREILDFRPPSRLPNAPPFLLGMIDVRGSTVPVIDLRIKLGLEPDAISPDSRIIVLDLDLAGGRRTIGLLTDRVFEVADLEDASLESVPEVGHRWKSDYIRSIGRIRGSFVIVFDLARLFEGDDIARLGATR